MPLRALLFDVDGTLLDSVNQHAQSWVEALEAVGFQFEHEVLRGLIGMGGRQLMARLLGEAGAAGAARDAPRLQAVIFKDRYLRQVRPFPKALALLQALGRKGIKRCLVSTVDRETLDQYLDMFNLDGLVDGLLSSSDVEVGKPAPDMYNAALRRNVLETKDAWVVGDSPWDIEAAERAGLESLAVLCGGYSRNSLAGARLILRDPAELLDKLELILPRD